MKIVSRTIPTKSEGIISRLLGRNQGPGLALGYYTRDLEYFNSRKPLIFFLVVFRDEFGYIQFIFTSINTPVRI